MRVRMGTSAAFTQHPSPCSQRAPEIPTAQATVGSEIPRQRKLRRLRPGSSHRDLSRYPIRACLGSLAWDAGTGGSAGCTLPPCGPCAASPRQCHRGRCSRGWRWEAGARRAAHWRRCGGVVNERGEDGHRKRAGYGAMEGQLQRVLRIAGDGARRVRVAQQAEVCSGDRRGRRGSRRRARKGDEGVMDDGNAAARRTSGAGQALGLSGG
jgi:hypothetical protein